MKTTKITKAQAIAIMINIMRERCFIPMAINDNGVSRYSYVGPLLMVKDILWYVSKFEGWSFRIVPNSEISEEFSRCGLHLNYYDVCVEFTNGDYSEQYLLWDLDYYKD